MKNNTQKLILGTVQFGLEYGINNSIGKPSQAEVQNILAQAYEAGIRCLDTAEAYGNAHEVIGNFHRSNPDMIFDVISKLPKDYEDSLESKIEKYLNQLNILKLEGLLFHSFESYKRNINYRDSLSRFKASGKIANIGVSIYTNKEMEEVIEDEFIDIIQLPFNLFDNINLRGGILQRAKEKGKIIHTRSAFLQGLFFADLNKNHKIVNALKSELSYLHELSQKNEVSVQKMAINYCIQQELIDKVLIGVESLDQLNQNLSDTSYKIPESLLLDINSITVNNSDMLNPSLWN